MKKTPILLCVLGTVVLVKLAGTAAHDTAKTSYDCKEFTSNMVNGGKFQKKADNYAPGVIMYSYDGSTLESFVKGTTSTKTVNTNEVHSGYKKFVSPDTTFFVKEVNTNTIEVQNHFTHEGYQAVVVQYCYNK